LPSNESYCVLNLIRFAEFDKNYFMKVSPKIFILYLSRYQAVVESLHLGSALQAKPMIAFPVVDEVSDQRMHLAFHEQKGMSTARTGIGLPHLSIADKPSFDAERSRLTLKWQQRIYDLSHWMDELELRERNAPAAILNPNRFVIQIPADSWQEILEAVQADDASNLHHYFQQAKEKVRDLASDTRFAKERGDVGDEG
jgi:hypothetical protein